MSKAHSHDHQAPYDQALSTLRAARLKITLPRQQILRILTTEHGPFTMEELHQRVKNACDLVTVYRCLAVLEDVGLVRRCDFGDGSCRYEFHQGSHHHHLICRRCRKIETLDICLIEELERDVRQKGYEDVSHALEFFGICPACQKG